MRVAAVFAIILFLATTPTFAEDAKYTNESVARMSFVGGKTFVQRASDLGFEEGALNMPISEGDRIATTEGRAEIHFGRGNYLRLDSETKLDVLNLPKKADESARIRVWSGSVYLVVGSLRQEKAIELHTADSSFYVLDKGVYRVDVRENRDTEIQVYEGLIEAAGEEGSTLLKGGQRLLISEGRFASRPSTFMAVAHDGFDKFNESRTKVTMRAAAKSYLPQELADFEADLEEHGEWVYLPPYGNVWVPGGVDDEWRPYWYGRWTWLPLTGWTWWPYEPWGWATFHYGRWHWAMGLGWYWIPAGIWGPAWVNWWWDPYYFAWAPLSYWGYPVVVLGGAFYGGYYGPYYPYGSRALTVVRKDHLKAPNVSANALRADGLEGLTKMSLTSRNLNLRPSGTNISVQPLDGNRVLLRRDDQATGLVRDRAIGREAIRSPEASTEGPSRAIRKDDGPGGAEAKPEAREGAAGRTSPTVKREGQAAKPAPARTSGSSDTKSTERKIRKKDGEPAASLSGAAGDMRSSAPPASHSEVQSSRTIHGYPSSPAISRTKIQGDGGAARSRSFVGPFSSGRSGGTQSRPSSIRSSGSSSGSSGSRIRSSSGSSGSSRGSSSGSRGSSSSGSRGSSGGGSVRKK